MPMQTENGSDFARRKEFNEYSTDCSSLIQPTIFDVLS